MSEITGCAHEGIYREYYHIPKERVLKHLKWRMEQYPADHLPSLTSVESLEESPDWAGMPLPKFEQLY